MLNTKIQFPSEKLKYPTNNSSSMDKEQAKIQKVEQILKRMEGAINYKGSASDLLHEVLEEN